MPETHVTRSNLNRPAPRSWAAPEVQSGSDRVGQRLSALTRAQRVLARATAAAILLSGLNALVQVGKVALEYLSRG